MYNYNHIDEIFGTPINKLPVSINNQASLNNLRLGIGIAMVAIIGIAVYSFVKDNNEKPAP